MILTARQKLNIALSKFESEYLVYNSNTFSFSQKIKLGEDKFTYEKLIKECDSIRKIVNKICKKQTVRIKGEYIKKHVYGAYVSDSILSLELDYKKSKGFIRKFFEQRLANISKVRLIDNFRYIFEIGTLTASPMLTPYGFPVDRDSNQLYQIDKSTLEEFESKNLLPFLHLDQTPFSNQKEFNSYISRVSSDRITKSELEQIYNDFKDNLDDDESINEFWDKLLTRIENESADAEFTLWELINEDELVVDSLLGSRQYEVVIGTYAVISRELEKMNNKGNIWQKINYIFRKIYNLKDFSFVELIQNIQKDDEKYKLLKSPSEETAHFKTLVDKAPEYMILPHIAYHMWSKIGFGLGKKIITDDMKLKFHQFFCFLEGDDSAMEKMTEHYKTYDVDEETIESELDLELISNLYKVDVKSWVKKLKSLKRYINVEDTPKYHGSGSKIDGILNIKYGINQLLLFGLMAAKKFPNGDKMLKEEDNVQTIIDMFFKACFGDKVFTVDNKNSTYNIVDSNFMTHLTSNQGGYGGHPNSHMGRSMYFLNDTLFARFKEYYDEEFGGDDNLKFAVKEIRMMRDVTNMNQLVWYEDSTSGKPVKCGYNSDGDKLKGNSAEHLCNNTNLFRVLRHKNPNSAEGRIVKTIKTPSDWYRHMANIQDKYEELHGGKVKRQQVQLALESYAEHLDTEGTK